MAADALITKGLELFASGDLAGAARTWLTAKKVGGADPQLDAYLDHIKTITGEVYAAIEAELGMTPVPVSAPINAVVFAPTSPPRVAVPPTAVVPPAPVVPPIAARSTPLPKPAAKVMPVPAAAPPFVAVAAPAPPTLRITPPSPLAPPASAKLELDYDGPGEPIFDEPELAAAEPPVPARVISLPPVVAPPPPVIAAPPPIIAPPPAALAAGPWGGDSVLGPPMVVKGPGGGLDLVAAKGRPTEPIAVPQGELAREEAQLKERLGLDDFSGALDLAERLLKGNPGHPLARAARERCRANLQQIYSSKLGSLERAPKVLVPPEQVIWLDLDHRTGFLLAQVDGISSYEDLIELSGMDRLEALRLIAQLVQKGVIGSR